MSIFLGVSHFYTLFMTLIYDTTQYLTITTLSKRVAYTFMFWIRLIQKKRLTIKSQSNVTSGASSRLIYIMQMFGQALLYLFIYDYFILFLVKNLIHYAYIVCGDNNKTFLLYVYHLVDRY